MNASPSRAANETVAWHALATEEVAARLAARLDTGLDSAEASSRA